jgi:hypothetical protein
MQGTFFTAQLSNAAGSFALPVAIGSLTQTTPGTIAAVIPANTTFGIGYRIRVVSSNPVVTGSDNGTNLTINVLPAAVAGANRSICLNQSTTIGAAAVLGSTYSWTSVPPGFTSTLANPTVTPLVTTTYTVVETVTATGCSNSHSVTVTVNPIPAAAAGANRAICLNQSTTIGAAAVGGSTYSWTSVPAGFTSTLANPTVTPLVTTIYTVVETITATGCTNTHSVTVTVIPLPVTSVIYHQ